MNCNELEKMIDRYLDRELSPAIDRAVKQHVTSCPACREKFGPLIELLAASWEVQVPPGLRSRVLGSIEERAIVSFPSKHTPWWRWSAAAAAIILVTAGGFIWSFSRPSSSPRVSPQHIATASENFPAAINPWILSGVVQSLATCGSVHPVISLVQADAMEQGFKGLYDAPILPARVRYTAYLPEPTKPEIEVPLIEYAIFSSVQKL